MGWLKLILENYRNSFILLAEANKNAGYLSGFEQEDMLNFPK